MTKVKSKREVVKEAQKAKNRSFCYADGQMSSQECGIGTQTFKSAKGRVVLLGDMVNRARLRLK